MFALGATLVTEHRSLHSDDSSMVGLVPATKVLGRDRRLRGGLQDAAASAASAAVMASGQSRRGFDP
jgi:hypothetical protein